MGDCWCFFGLDYIVHAWQKQDLVLVLPFPVARKLLQLFVGESIAETSHGLGGLCTSVPFFLDFLPFEFHWSGCGLLFLQVKLIILLLASMFQIEINFFEIMIFIESRA